MSVCGRVAICGSDGRQWRGRGRRATAAPGFSQGIYKGFIVSFAGVTPWCEYRPAGTRESAFQQRFDLLVEFLERGLAPDHVAIDEEGRRRTDLQHLGGEFLVGGDLVEQRLVLEAVV